MTTYYAKSNIKHNGVLFAKGDEVTDITDAEAKLLVKQKVLSTTPIAESDEPGVDESAAKLHAAETEAKAKAKADAEALKAEAEAELDEDEDVELPQGNGQPETEDKGSEPAETEDEESDVAAGL